ncbi:Lnb N-terminal periplasmic domain-containing protein [Janthinobacterium agaricidamnosum]|uniref:Putative transmembrane protein n=1 Tax=Janthinobacterium agaricidamnosum NBRC 102515 = DSM 9628 TaxID=1349767 RepID=W0V8D5_9BURK|nr:DUF4105 domain-containing protein [Janthinobacterium agaricidamnosum]CDG83870.1 putative transmembrane protein [Janthinobacterium agaricidamnosum NBRC 102515 = DSM 9628]
MTKLWTSTWLTMSGRVLGSLLVLLSAAWGALALWYHLAGGLAAQSIGAVLWAALGIGSVLLWWQRGSARALLPYGAGFVLMLGWWSLIAPSQDRVWADDVSRMVSGRVNGSLVTLDNVRNFDWRSDTDYTARWESRTYDLDRLKTVDVALSYWTGPLIAHTLVSFGFDDGRYLTFSIEIRKQRGESFSAIGGFFKHFETSLIAADERDILRVRTNVRGEDMQLYRAMMPRAAMRSLFMAYVDEGYELQRAPRFYNTLTANCTTIIFEMARRIVPGLPMDYRLLASGYLDRYLFDVGALVPGYTFSQLRAAGHITARARAANETPNFSQAIRAGMPLAPAVKQ